MSNRRNSDLGDVLVLSQSGSDRGILSSDQLSEGVLFGKRQVRFSDEGSRAEKHSP